MKASINLLTAAILWALNFQFAKQMLYESSFLEAGSWRYLFGVITLLLIGFRSLPSFSFIKENWLGPLLVGFIGLFGFNIFFFLGIRTTTPINAALIISLNPATTLVLSYLLLKTQITRNQMVGILIALVGVLYLLAKGEFSILTAIKFSSGDLLVFVANLLFALYHVWVKKYSKAISNKHFTLFTSGVCALAFLIALGLTDETAPSLDHSANFWLFALGIGSFGTASAYLLWNNGVALVGADKASIYMNFVPLATALSAGLFWSGAASIPLHKRGDYNSGASTYEEVFCSTKTVKL